MAVIFIPILIWLLMMPDSSSKHWKISQDEMMDEFIKSTKSE
jgi:hypothetical protein